MVNVVTVSSLSKTYVFVEIHATESGALVNPSALPVEMAFPLQAVAPVSGDWKTASWEVVAGTPVQYRARCTVGPSGTVTLAAGRYDIWVRITTSPEVPVLRGGVLVVT